MRYNSIKDFDIKQGDGINVSLWTQGCSKRCRGCHNPETWNFDGGQSFTFETITEIIKLLTKDKIHKNLSILGGEPLEEVNLEKLASLVCWVKILTKSKIWLWTSFEFEELVRRKDKNIETILNNIDYLVDGEFIEDCKIEARYKGSSNQRVIDVKESFNKHRVITRG